MLLHDDAELHSDYVGTGQLTVPNSALVREDRKSRVSGCRRKTLNRET